MALNLSKIATILNAVAAVGATLEATGVLNTLGPTGIAIAGALLAAINAIAHALAPPAPVK